MNKKEAEQKIIKWPSIRATQNDREVLHGIKTLKGPFRSMAGKDIMLIAAALAIRENLPADEELKKQKMLDIVSYSNLNADNYCEYRQYVTLVYYITAAKRNVENMSNPAAIAKNFEDYAHRGILFLKDKYLGNKKADDELTMEFLEMMTNFKEKYERNKKKEKQGLEEEERNLKS